MLYGLHVQIKFKSKVLLQSIIQQQQSHKILPCNKLSKAKFQLKYCAEKLYIIKLSKFDIFCSKHSSDK